MTMRSHQVSHTANESHGTPAPRRHVGSAWVGTAIVIGLLATAVRLPGCFSELWLDEVWTLYLTIRLDSPVEILTKFDAGITSNAGPLTELMYFLIGDRDESFVYRIVPLVCGVGVVMLAMQIAGRVGRLEAIVAGILTGGSYPLIHFSSEARAYSILLVLSLATFLIAQHLLERPRWWKLVLLWLCICMGVAAHLTYLHVLAGLGLWTLVCLSRTADRVRSVAWGLAQFYAVPTAFLVWFHWIFIRHVIIGGAPGYVLMDVIVKTLSFAAGGPASGPFATTVAIIMLVATIWAIAASAGQPQKRWIFYVITIVMSPLFVLIITQPPVLYLRYFMISITFGLIVIACWLVTLARRGQGAYACVIVVILLFLAGNGVQVSKLVRYGRGGYRQAVHYMADRTPGPTVVVTSDHGFRKGMLLWYYQRFLPAGKALLYVRHPDAPANAGPLEDKDKLFAPADVSQVPEWMIASSEPNPAADEEPFIITFQPLGVEAHYYRVNTWPSADLSGANWLLYRRQNMTLLTDPPRGER